MKSDRIQKVLKFLNPVSCREMRDWFETSSHQAVPAEQEKAIQEHLLICEECLFAYADRIGQKVDSGELPLQEWPSTLPLPPMELYHSYNAASEATEGESNRTVVRSAASQEIDWAKEKASQLYRWVADTMKIMQFEQPRPLPDLAGLAAQPVLGGTGTTTIKAVAGGEPVLFEITEGPVITADGRFILTLETADSRCEGGRVICTLSLVEGRKVNFDGILQLLSPERWQARITAEGLPESDSATVVPIDLLSLELIPAAAQDQ